MLWKCDADLDSVLQGCWLSTPAGMGTGLSHSFSCGCEKFLEGVLPALIEVKQGNAWRGVHHSGSGSKRSGSSSFIISGFLSTSQETVFSWVLLLTWLPCFLVWEELEEAVFSS